MISKEKQYRTRNGREVRIYATDGFGIWAVHGAILVEDGWWSMCWSKDGKFICGGVYDGSPSSSSDLIEVKPRIKKAVWLHVFKDGNVVAAVDPASANITHRIACVKVEIDCEEGEGL